MTSLVLAGIQSLDSGRWPIGKCAPLAAVSTSRKDWPDWYPRSFRTVRLRESARESILYRTHFLLSPLRTANFAFCLVNRSKAESHFIFEIEIMIGSLQCGWNFPSENFLQIFERFNRSGNDLLTGLWFGLIQFDRKPLSIRNRLAGDQNVNLLKHLLLFRLLFI